MKLSAVRTGWSMAGWATGLVPLIAAVALATPLAALATTPSEEQGPISTAPAVKPAATEQPLGASPRVPAETRPLTTDEQIAAFIRSTPATPWSNDAPLTDSGTSFRQIHGQVGVSVGTGGYRSAYAQADIPVGRTGVLSVAVAETRSDPLHGSYPGYGYDPLYGGAGFGYDGYGRGPGGGLRQSFGLFFQSGDGRIACPRRPYSSQRAQASTGVMQSGRCARQFDGRLPR